MDILNYANASSFRYLLYGLFVRFVISYGDRRSVAEDHRHLPFYFSNMLVDWERLNIIGSRFMYTISCRQMTQAMLSFMSMVTFEMLMST